MTSPAEKRYFWVPQIEPPLSIEYSAIRKLLSEVENNHKLAMEYSNMGTIQVSCKQSGEIGKFQEQLKVASIVSQFCVGFFSASLFYYVLLRGSGGGVSFKRRGLKIEGAPRPRFPMPRANPVPCPRNFRPFGKCGTSGFLEGLCNSL